MRKFLEKLSNEFLGKPFNVCNMNIMENEIRKEIYREYPEIEKRVQVDGVGIYVDNDFFKNNNGAICFLPCIFSIKEKFFYDIYIGRITGKLRNGIVPVGQIAFKRSTDPVNYGYDITTRSFCGKQRDILGVYSETNAKLDTVG